MADTKRGNAIYANDIAAIAPVSLNDRIDAQNADDVPIASNDAIRGLYRPVTMLVIVVGNEKADSTRALIDKWFGAGGVRSLHFAERDRLHCFGVITFVRSASRRLPRASDGIGDSGHADAGPMDLANYVCHALADGRYLIPPEAMLRYAGMTFPQISAQAVSRWWRARCGSCDRGGSGRINGNLYL